MLTWSYAIHILVFGALIAIPRDWFIGTRRQPEKVLMITLGGLAGPKETGPTTIGGKPVEEVVPQPKRPEPVKAVATKSDAMIVPTKGNAAEEGAAESGRKSQRWSRLRQCPRAIRVRSSRKATRASRPASGESARASRSAGRASEARRR